MKLHQESTRVMNIPVSAIRPNPYQPRKQFEDTLIDELAASIKEFGVIQPITVRRMGPGEYELVSGERRLRACRRINLTTIPALIVDIDDNDSAVIALIENLHRKDLSFLEEAEGYYHLLAEHGLTQEELALKLGKSQSAIANKIRLLKLPDEVKRILRENNLTERHARALLRLPDEETQLEILKKICKKGLNVSAAEKLIEKELEALARGKMEESFRKRSAEGKVDYRIVFNTLSEAVDMLRKIGAVAKTKKVERATYIEYIVRIEKSPLQIDSAKGRGRRKSVS